MKCDAILAVGRGLEGGVVVKWQGFSLISDGDEGGSNFGEI
jgi:hypothetical protein